MTLMEMQDKPDPRQAEILPVVRYAALQKAKRSVDYWDHATLMELAVIGRDLADAEDKLSDLLASAPSTAPWQLETTERQMRLDPGAARKARRGRRRRDQGPGGGAAREAPCARGGAEEGVVTYRRDSYLNSSDLITIGTTLVNSMTLPIST